MRVFGRLAVSLVFASILLETPHAFALPIGFGRNQGDLEYDELKTKDFIVYHDRRAPEEAKAILEALEAARPRLQSWIGVERKKPLPVLLSSTTSNASFANFITDAIELQTLGRGGRDLAWHEYTHSTMYRHLDNVFGPAGSIIHLPWMPAWWIEGLAESTSVSNGSDVQYGVERYYAINGDWPTYDKLHALYDGTRFSTIGYAISGSFVSYLLRTYDANKLPKMLDAFYHYSMPWYWPWSFVPFNKFMPMDQALTEWTGKTGLELYEEYKIEAAKYWKSRRDLAFVLETDNQLKLQTEGALSAPPLPKASPQKGMHAGQSISFNSSYFFETRGDEVYALTRDGGDLFETRIKWKDQASNGTETLGEMPDDMVGPRIVRPDSLIYMTADINSNLDNFRYFWIKKDEKKKKLFKRDAYVLDIYLSKDKLVWVEEKLERQQLCYVARSEVEKFKPIANQLIKCMAPVNFPQSLRILGTRTAKDSKGQDLLAELWLGRSEETLLGDRHSILIWNPDTLAVKRFQDPLHGKPLSIAFNTQGLYIAYADLNSHFLRHFDANGRCVDEQLFGNMIDRLFNNSKDQIVMSLWKQEGILLVRGATLPGVKTACRAHDEPTSPLQVAMRYPQANFKEILAQRNPWKQTPPSAMDADSSKIAKQALLGTALPEEVKSLPSQWRPRPVFVFPWIGIDAQGPTYGIISIPLMDHLQNETVQLLALYGPASRFADVSLSMTSNRFETSWGLDLFRRQTWNGVYGNQYYKQQTYYFEERGAQISAARYIYSLGLSVRLAYKQADLLPFIGNDDVWNQIAKGYIRETTLSLSKSHQFYWSSLSYYLNSNLATKFDNSNYDYEQTGVGTNLSIPLSLFGRVTTQNWGLSYSRDRGPRRKLLKEAYRPLRTYVPGSGGGLNEINQPIFGPGALTSAVYGDTQARANFSWTFPVMPDLAKLVHIVYLQRLDFTAFFNYGNAWFQQNQPSLKDAIKAHGYNLDLTADIKGVKLNAGIGVGQVVGQDWEMYALFGFDALISQGER